MPRSMRCYAPVARKRCSTFSRNNAGMPARHRLSRSLPVPVADASRVDVHEIGFRIVADAAALELEREIPQRCTAHAAQAYVDRLALQVHAALGDAGAARAQQVVGRL